MNEETPNLQPWIEPELEARVVAWVLGEASEFETAELERVAAEKPELAIFKRRIEAVHGLVGASMVSEKEPLRLAPERRQLLLNTFGDRPKRTKRVAVVPQAPPRSWLSVAMKVAACLLVCLVLAGLLFPSMNAVKMSARRSAPQNQDHYGGAQFSEEARDALALQESLVPAEKRPRQSATPEALADWNGKPEGAKTRELYSQADDFSDRSGFGIAGERDRKKVAEETSTATESQSSTRSDLAWSAEPSNRPAVAFDSDGAAAESGQSDSQRRWAKDRSEVGELAGGNDFYRWSSEAVPAAAAAPRAETEGKIVGLKRANETEMNLEALAAAAPVTSAPQPAEEPVDKSKESESTAHFAVTTATPKLAEADQFEVSSASPQRQTSLDGYGGGGAGGARQMGQDKNKLGLESSADHRRGGEAPVAGPAADAKVPMLGDIPVTGSVFESGAATSAGTIVAADAEKGNLAIVGNGSINAPATPGQAVSVPRKPGFVTSPYAPYSGYVDTRAFPPGTEVKDPYTGKVFPVPDSTIPLTIAKGEVRSELAKKTSTASNDRSRERIASDEVAAKDQPFSTFSLHVGDVSFRLAQAALAKGQRPDAESIRPEEFYNAFDYGDPAAATGEKVTCNIEQSAHPFLQQRNLVRIAMKVPAIGRGKGQPLRLTVLLDTSGSMERDDRVASVRRAMEVLASLLGPDDRVTLIGFARRPRLLADQLPGDQAARLVEMIERTPSEGGTNLEEALKLAGEKALNQRAKAAQNRIVLLTDGAANLGNAKPAQLGRMIEQLRQHGIAFDACGVGADGLDDEILEALTRKGDGRYYFLDRPEDADVGFARQLAGAFRPAAQNVKVQVRFNPARVGSYRLIGFGKHRLKKEDFRNDKVDAAELAAEEAAVAIYQVEALPQGDGELGEVFVRFRDAANGEMVERSWTMAYDAQARAFDQAPPTMQLAGTAALLAEKLRGGAMASQVDLDALAPVVSGLRGHFPAQARVQQLATMFEKMRRMK